ncbi:hairy-related 4.2, partial [Silurus meridionalis]
RELITAQIFSSQNTNRRNTVMAPTITASMVNSNHLLPLNNKLRKPIVEKMRRERINCSIEKLKSLLGAEFLKQQPDSRQEKADILEMTLSFLRQQQQSHKSSSSNAADEGYSRCVQDAIHFLSQCQVHTQSQRRLLSHFLTMQLSVKKSRSVISQFSSPACQISSKEETKGCRGLWRP